MAAALETITVTATNVKEIATALQQNQVNSLLIRVNDWENKAVFLQALNSIAENCQNNSTLKKIRVDQFDFKQSAQPGIATPSEMAKFLVFVANNAKQLQTIDLGESRLHGCADFFNTEILKNLKVQSDSFKIICNGIPSVQAIPLVSGKKIWQNEVKEPGFFSKRPEASENESETSEKTPTSGKRW